MKQRLEIKNFGPLHNVKLDIDNYMVFIGPNAAGKSTIAKLVYFFRSLEFFKNNLNITLDITSKYFETNIYEVVEDTIKRQFRLFWDIEALQDDFKVTFYPEYDEKNSKLLFVCLKKSSVNLSVEWSKDFRNIINKQIDSARRNYLKKIKEKPTLENEYQYSRMLYFETFGIFNYFFNSIYESCFIPAGRQILSLPTDNMPLFNEGRFDYLLGSFMSSIKRSKPIFNIYIDEFKERAIKKAKEDKKNIGLLTVSKECLDLTCQLINKILKGKYISTREGDRIYLNEKQFVKLYEASSGQQEVLWILNIILILISQMNGMGSKFNQFTIIEEPEAHLFPETQRDITNLISLLANQKNQQVIITTHSPYILMALNNLLYAHKLGKKKPKETVAKINPLLWVDDNRLAVYIVENGTIRDIIDRELEMISTEEIDYVSRIINGEFDSLFDLKYS
jgi:AAA15 family ATPase/GTPase